MSRRKPKPNPAALGDLYDYLSGPLPTTGRSTVSPVVSDDWPDVVPIGLHELQITEAYLEKVLAELFGPLP
jgi:hypothetical protein